MSLCTNHKKTYLFFIFMVVNRKKRTVTLGILNSIGLEHCIYLHTYPTSTLLNPYFCALPALFLAGLQNNVVNSSLCAGLIQLYHSRCKLTQSFLLLPIQFVYHNRYTCAFFELMKAALHLYICAQPPSKISSYLLHRSSLLLIYVVVLLM